MGEAGKERRPFPPGRERKQGGKEGADARGRAVATSDMSVWCSAPSGEGGRLEVQSPRRGAGPAALCSFLCPTAGRTCQCSGSGRKSLSLALGEVPGLGSEWGPHSTWCWAGWGCSLRGAWGPPLTSLLSCGRWGEEQLPDGQIQKYWVSVGGCHEFVGTRLWRWVGARAAFPCPGGIQLGVGGEVQLGTPTLSCVPCPFHIIYSGCCSGFAISHSLTWQL